MSSVKPPTLRPNTKQTEVEVRAEDLACIDALARILEANGAASDQLRSQLEQILADQAGRFEEVMQMPSWISTRH